MITMRGKAVALAALAARRAAYAGLPPINNAGQPAGSPIYLHCISCAEPIAHPEHYVVARRLCAECEALKICGWLE